MLRSASLIRTSTRSITMRSIQTFGKPDLDYRGVFENEKLFKDTILKKKLSHNVLKQVDYIKDNYPVVATLGKELGELKRKREEMTVEMREVASTNSHRADEIKQNLRNIKNSITKLDKERNRIKDKMRLAAEDMPTLVDGTIPKGIRDEEVVALINCESIEQVETNSDKKALSHKVIGEKLGLLDLETAARVCGHAFYYLLGDAALLEQALVQYALNLARAKGYKIVAPPTMVRQEVIGACGFRPRDQGEETQVYDLVKDHLSLTGTAEIPLAALESKKIFTEKEVEKFPVKYVGVARSYRAEAGSRGATTAGLYRVHEFTKVELFHFTTPDRARQELEELREFQTDFITLLGLKAKVLNMPSSDLGAPAAKKYDIEAWMPGRKTWGELTSSSWCGEYQARRMGIRYRASEGKVNYVHTLNGTAVAVPRVIVAILENFYDAETESIEIPEVLRVYMGGRDRIYKNE